MTAIGRLCPVIIRIVPSLRNLPRRGPTTMAPGERGDSSGHVDDRRAREVHVPVSEAEVDPERREPAPPHTQFANSG